MAASKEKESEDEEGTHIPPTIARTLDRRWMAWMWHPQSQQAAQKYSSHNTIYG